MPRYSLKVEDFNVLSAIGDRGGATIPEVAGIFRLTPSEMHAILGRLSEQSLVKESSDNTGAVALSRDGTELYRSLQRVNLTLDEGDVISVTAPNGFGATDVHNDSDLREAQAALDREIARLTQTAPV